MQILTALLLLALQENEPADVKAGGKGVTMDYGPFLSSTVCKSKYKKESDVLSHKAITIRLANNASYCFDPDLLRAAGGWTGGFLDLTGTHLTSYKGSLPTTLSGTLQFTSSPIPGWSAGDFEDPRANPYGPLPAERGRYIGLYLHDRDIVLSYEVEGCPILEHPAGEGAAITRTFRAGPSSRPLSLLVCEDLAGLQAAALGADLVRENGRMRVNLPALAEPRVFKVVIGAKSAAPPVDPAPLCKGGPARWKDALATQGVLGKGDGAYLVDTLTVPEKNPWNSWLRFTALDFFPDGRAAVSTWNGDVWIASGIDDTLGKLEWRRFATGLYEPLGLRIVNDTIHVLARDQILRLHDLNGDGEADFYESFFNGLITMANYHAFAFELHTDPQGNFYCAQVGHRIEPEIPEHGCVLKIAKDGRSHEVFATGFRAPNGMSVGPNGEVTASDNQGNWMPASRVNWVKKGGFYGYVPHSGRAEPPKDHDKPICWIPMAMDNSSGGQVWVTSDRWGPFQGHLLHTSYGTASLFHLPYEHVEGEVQGGVVKFPLTFASGIMRGRFHPKDGQLYVAGLRGWQTTGVRDAALQRVRYTGKPVHTLHSFKATRKGLELTFTNPLDPGTAGDVESWGVLRWNYAWTEKYGSPDFSLENPKKQARDSVEVTSAKLSADGKTVFLEIPSMRPAMQMQVKARLRAADGTPVSIELYNTVNRLPQ